MSAEPQPVSAYIPVDVAADIAGNYNQDAVIIVGVRRSTITTVTFGATPETKIMAAETADKLVNLLGATLETVHEDFRDLDAAKFAARLDPLLEMKRQLATLAGNDASIAVLLSQVRHWKELADRYVAMMQS